MIRTSISITIVEWNICDCPGKSRTYGTKTPEALMTWMRITMTLVFLWVSTPEFWAHQSPPHPGAFACNLSTPKPASLICPFSPFRSQLNAISLNSCSGILWQVVPTNPVSLSDHSLLSTFYNLCLPCLLIHSLLVSTTRMEAKMWSCSLLHSLHLVPSRE